MSQRAALRVEATGDPVAVSNCTNEAESSGFRGAVEAETEDWEDDATHHVADAYVDPEGR